MQGAHHLGIPMAFSVTGDMPLLGGTAGTFSGTFHGEVRGQVSIMMTMDDTPLARHNVRQPSSVVGEFNAELQQRLGCRRLRGEEEE